MSNRSTYWRGGYQIEGAREVTVEEYGRTKDIATNKATFVADQVADNLARLGLAQEVTVWTQKWTSWTETKTEDRVDGAVIKKRAWDPESIQMRLQEVEGQEAAR